MVYKWWVYLIAIGLIFAGVIVLSWEVYILVKYPLNYIPHTNLEGLMFGDIYSWRDQLTSTGLASFSLVPIFYGLLTFFKRKKNSENYKKSGYLQEYMKYRIIIEQDEVGVFVVECPSLPGCVSQGKTRAEAIVNIKDAMEGYLESLQKHQEPIPPPIEEEVVDIHA